MIEWILLIFLSFLPPLIYTIWIRNTEKYHREKWKSIAICFLWGSTIAIVASLILELIIGIPLSISIHDNNLLFLIVVVVIAPIVEEFTKPFALRLKSVKLEIDELEDGLIYGAVAGLGFSATENLFFGLNALSQSLFYFIMIISIRSVGACLLHASATSLTGYGYSKTIIGRTSFLKIIPYFFLAIIVHSLYNLLVSVSLIWMGIGTIIAFLLVVFTIYFIRKKIKVLDEKDNL